jgi:UPF0148 protein
MQKDDDQLIKKMAKLLREGATMMDKSCPKCGNLIYRLPNKKIICPSCNSEIIIQNDTPLQQSQSSDISSKPQSFVPLLNTLQIKLEYLTQKLQNETDFSQIERIINILEKTINIYEKIYQIMGIYHANT